MMTRKAYIDWKRLDRNAELENGKTYMVFMPDMESMAGTIGFAEYYDACAMVNVPLRDDYKPYGQEPTAEQKLLAAIFGRHRGYVVPMDGFYESTADYGVDEKCENGAFEGCSKQVHMVGNRLPDGTKGALPVFWAECPLLPDGFKAVTDPGEPPARKLDPDDQELRDGLEDSECAMYAYRSMAGKRDIMPGDGDIEAALPGATARTSASSAASIVLRIWKTAQDMAAIPEDDVMAFHKKFTASKDTASAGKLWSKFCEEHDVRPENSGIVLKYIRGLSDEGPGFFQNRDRILARGGYASLDNVKVMAEAWGATRFPFRIARLVKVLRMQAPGVIVQNELRQACEAYAAWKLSDYIFKVDAATVADMFGIWPDGSRSENCTYAGDAELHRAYLERAAADGGDGNGDGGELPCECQSARHELAMRDTYAKREGADRYGIAYLPNFMMRRKGFVILDFWTDQYVKDENGDVRIWDECPRDRLSELNSGNNT